MPPPARPGVVLLSPSMLAALKLAPGDRVRLTAGGTSASFLAGEGLSAGHTEILVDATALVALRARMGDAVSLDVLSSSYSPASFGIGWLDKALATPPPFTPSQGAVQVVPGQRPAQPPWLPSQPAPSSVEPADLPVEAPSLDRLPGSEVAAKALVDTLRLALFDRERLTKLGAVPQLGVLLSGPARAGKTALVRAVAADLDVELRELSGGKLASIVPDAALRELTRSLAAPTAPTLVLLEDVELLADVERPSPLLHSLAELLSSAFASGLLGVVATSSAPARVAPLLLTPELLSRRVSLAAPSRSDRLRILEVLLDGKPLAADVALADLAERTPGFLPGDLVALVRTASLEAAAHPDRTEVTAADFRAALSQVHASSLERQLEVGSLTLDDVGGLTEVKALLTEAVLWPLAYPESFTRLGITPPKGVLLYGPPGCGKTFVVRALAASGAANLFVVKGAELLDKYVGESEAGVRELFRKARAAAPSIVFLDELDALAPVRGSDNSGVSDRVVASLLTELDGVEALRDVVVIGATNRPDMVDPALLRPGRLERKVLVSAPDAAARGEILRSASKRMPLAKDVDLVALGESLDGFSSADCDALMREAALVALRESREAEVVTAAHVEAARSRVSPSLDPALIAMFEAYAAQERG